MMPIVNMKFFRKIAIFLMAIPLYGIGAQVANISVTNNSTSTAAELSQQLDSLKLEIAEQAHDISNLQLSTQQEFKRVDERLTYVEKSLNVLSASPQPASESESASNAFNAAMNFVKEMQYQQAQSALQAFVIAYHSSDYVPRAYYELSAIEVKLNDFNKAMYDLNVLINSYPTSPYVLQAMVLLGDIHNSLGEWDVAKKQWNDVVRRYPNTPEATRAQSLLLQLQQAGH